MDCPFCGSQMKTGIIAAPSEHGVFWMPEDCTLHTFLLTKKNIEDAGGRVLGGVTKFGFYTTTPPSAFFCKKCKVYLVQEVQ